MVRLFLVLVCAAVSASASAEGLIASEINKEEANGHYLFDGNWTLATPHPEIGDVQIEAKSLGSSSTYAKVTIQGSLAQSLGYDVFTSFDLKKDSLGSVQIADTKSKSFSHQYYTKWEYIDYRTGQRTPAGTTTITKYHSCDVSWIKILGNPKVKGKLEFQLWHRTVTGVKWPSQVDTQSKNYLRGSPECLGSAPQQVTSWLTPR